MSEFKMSTTELRDKLLERRTLFLQAVEASNQKAKEIHSILDTFTEDKIQALANIGIDIRNIAAFDVERAQRDSEYANLCNEQLKSSITALHAYLEESLNV